MKPITVVLNSVLLSTFLTACGGSGGGSGGGSSPPSGGGGGGSGSTTFTVSGTITGNANPIALSLNGNAQSFNGGSFTFSQSLGDGAAYNVQFVSSGGANESCTVMNGTGTIAGADITDIDVSCAQVSAMSVLQYDNLAINGSLAAGDFNGDGFTDLAFSVFSVAGFPSGASLDLIRFAFGNGLGTFPNVIDKNTTCRSVTKREGRLLSFDFDGDLFDDLVCTGADTGIEVFQGNMAGNPSSGFTSGERDQGVLSAVDVDMDGLNDILDLAWDGDPAFTFGYYINQGSGNFAPRQTFASQIEIQNASGISFISPLNYAIADIDGDLRSDLISIIANSTISLDLVVFKGNSAGGFDLPTSFVALPDTLFTGESWSSIVSKDMALGDFDQDGDQDLAITSTTDFILLLENDGTGGFSVGDQVLVGFVPVQIEAADFNLDGFIDLVTTNQDTHSIHISYGFGDGSFGSVDTGVADYLSIPLDSGVDLYDMVIADFDGNSYPDIAVAENALDVPGPVNGQGSIQIIMNPAQ